MSGAINRAATGTAVVFVVALAFLCGGALVTSQEATTCAQAVEKADEVLSSTTELGLAMVEHAKAEEWHARSLAAANVEHLTASLEVEVPRYEALRDECRAER